MPRQKKRRTEEEKRVANRAATRKYAAKNKQAKSDYAREWRNKNPDKVKAQKKRSHLINKEKNNERTRAWRKRNPEKVLMYNAKLKAGLYAVDKTKRRERNRRYQNENPERTKAYQAKYKKNNRNKILVGKKKYRLENKERLRLDNKRIRESDPQKYKEQSRVWRINNPSKVKEYKRKSNVKRREKNREYSRKYNSLYPEKSAARCSKRRASLRLHAESDSAKINDIFKITREISISSGVSNCVDHIIPLECGGYHHQENLQPLPVKVNGSGGKWRNPFWLSPSPAYKDWRDVPRYLWPVDLAPKYLALIEQNKGVSIRWDTAA